MSRIVSWLLNGVYLAVLFVASPWILWAALKYGKHREGFAEKLLGRVPHRKGIRPCVWLHAVSVGEVNLLETTLSTLERKHPGVELVISTTTKTGYDLAQRKYSQHTVFYCPLDFSWAAHNALWRVRPNLLVLAELELWPNLIRTAKAHGTKVAIINGRLSDNSFRGYRRLRPIVARLLRKIDLIAAQDEQTAERFRWLGANPASVVTTGSLKFDGANTDRDNPRSNTLRRLANIRAQDTVFLVGSTQAPEEQYGIDIYQKLAVDNPNLRLILVPRHPERFAEVARLLEHSGIAWMRRSELEIRAGEGVLADTAHADTTNAAILVDTIGELSAWWGTATVGFVGGSFGTRGGQNMLEPAAYGVATCFGPNTRNFRDIVGQLLAVGGAQEVDGREALEKFVRQAIEKPDTAKQMGERARALVMSQQGATERTVALLVPLIANVGSAAYADIAAA